MTSDEIKQAVSMRDILRHCGLPEPNRGGFICCPFHKGDREPSMKIHADSYYCFACQRSGDIFRFVQEYESVSFREAFLSLGGTYPDRVGESRFGRQRRKYELLKRRETARRRAEREELEKSALRRETYLLGLCMRLYKPLSDDWCDCYNAWQKAEYRLEYLNGKR